MERPHPLDGHSHAHPRRIGVIGGSGLYDVEGLTDVAWVDVDTPFGAPSDAILTGRLGDRALAFLPRHGRGHRVPPHRINYRANLYAMKKLGVEWIVSVSAVGSMREEIHPGDVLVPDQYIDRTNGRPATFFEDGIVAHVTFSDPACRPLRAALTEAARSAGVRAHDKGTYVCIDGPQFSTRAESQMYRSFGVDVIGMTALPEAKLAREAELCYATLALVTDYDCWHSSGEEVSVAAVLAVLQKNISVARNVVRKVAALVSPERVCPCPTALDAAIMTSPDRVPPEARSRLSAIIERVDRGRGRS